MVAESTQPRPLPGDADAMRAPQVRPSPDEDRAVVRSRARGAREHAQQLHAIVEEARAEARKAAEVAIAALAEADGLRRALDTRAQIEMAKGILMERHRIDPDEAFRMLVAASQRGQLKVAEVARALVQKTVPSSGGH